MPEGRGVKISRETQERLKELRGDWDPERHHEAKKRETGKCKNYKEYKEYLRTKGAVKWKAFFMIISLLSFGEIYANSRHNLYTVLLNSLVIIVKIDTINIY